MNYVFRGWFYADQVGGRRVRMVDPDEKTEDPEMLRLDRHLNRLPNMLRQAHIEKDALAINWLETLSRATEH